MAHVVEVRLTCSNFKCTATATWVRNTQFAGRHLFCAKCAKKELDFGLSDPSSFSWEKLPTKKTKKKKTKSKVEHPLRVAGYNGSLQKLAQTILRMRYDKVEKFFLHCEEELNRQADEDWGRGRKQLANLLWQASITVARQRYWFRRISALCEPYMPNKRRK